MCNSECSLNNPAYRTLIKLTESNNNAQKLSRFGILLRTLRPEVSEQVCNQGRASLLFSICNDTSSNYAYSIRSWQIDTNKY